MQHVSTRSYEVGCSAHWSHFNWASVSTLKIKHSHPYTQILDFQFLDWGKLQSWSSASSESSSATSTVLPFVHEVPWQWPQASVHFRPFLRQVHLAEVQSVVQSHRMTLSSSGGADGRSVNTGEYPESVSFQPHDSSCKLQWGFFHWQICRYTLSLWNFEAAVVGGRLFSLTFLATFSQYFLFLSAFRDSFFFPLHISTKAFSPATAISSGAADSSSKTFADCCKTVFVLNFFNIWPCRCQKALKWYHSQEVHVEKEYVCRQMARCPSLLALGPKPVVLHSSLVQGQKRGLFKLDFSDTTRGQSGLCHLQPVQYLVH